jgi:hypothetical protein
VTKKVVGVFVRFRAPLHFFKNSLCMVSTISFLVKIQAIKQTIIKPTMNIGTLMK